VVALLMVATFEALVSVRSAVQLAVSVIGGAERLDDLAATPSGRDTSGAAWPGDETLALRDVAVPSSTGWSPRLDVDIAARRRVAVCGPSGSGKSTLLRALARLDDVARGTITLGGVDLQDIAEDELRRHVVLVPSEPGLVRGYVRDVLGMGAPLIDEDLADLSSLGISVDRNDQWEELSRGERQRVALVRALVRRPRVVLLDEPTSALGEHETTLVLDLLSRVSATIIVATHDPRVIDWCDQVLDVTEVNG